MINPAVVEGQIAGGLAQAIGSVLLEEIRYDAQGNPTAATFKDYLLPTISDVPDFEYIHVCTPSKAEGGFRGVGEGGAIIGPPALVNAIADALSPFNARCLDLPLTPSRILALIEGRSAPKNVPARAAEAAPAPVIPQSSTASERTETLAGTTPVTESVDGAWKITLSTPMGPQHFTAHFTTQGDTLSGRLDSDMGSQDFTGKIEGSKLSWTMKVTKPMPLTLKYDIRAEGSRLAGKVKMGMFGTAKLTGERMG